MKNIPVLRFDDLIALSRGSFPPPHSSTEVRLEVSQIDAEIKKEASFGICCLSLYL